MTSPEDCADNWLIKQIAKSALQVKRSLRHSVFYERQVKSPSTSVPYQRPLSLAVTFIQQGRLAHSLTVAFDRELEEGPILTTAVVT